MCNILNWDREEYQYFKGCIVGIVNGARNSFIIVAGVSHHGFEPQSCSINLMLGWDWEGVSVLRMAACQSLQLGRGCLQGSKLWPTAYVTKYFAVWPGVLFWEHCVTMKTISQIQLVVVMIRHLYLLFPSFLKNQASADSLESWLHQYYSKNGLHNQVSTSDPYYQHNIFIFL